MKAPSIKKIIMGTLFFSGLILSTVSHAGWWHNGYHHGGYYRGGYYHGYYRSPAIIVGGPARYYAPRCAPVRVCNRHGRCWLQRRC